VFAQLQGSRRRRRRQALTLHRPPLRLA
jgi:hypothetical protein